MASSSGANRGKRARGGEINISIYPTEVRGLTSSQQTRYNLLSLRRIQPCRYFDNTVVDVMRVRSELVDRLTDMGCISLLNADWRSYKLMIVEFLATFKYKEDSGAVKFRLGNRSFHVNKSVICDIFNWPANTDSIPENFEDELWANITLGRGGNFDAHHSNIAEVPYHAYRYFHRVLTYTICGRSESNHKVSKTELEILYYFHNRRRADLAGILLRRFRNVQERNLGAIGIGGFITAIAIHVANFDPFATSLDFIPGPSTVDSQVAVHMKLLARGAFGQLQYLPEENIYHDADSDDETENEDGNEGEEAERREEERVEGGEPSNVDMGGQPSFQEFGQPSNQETGQQSYSHSGQYCTYEQFDARFSAFEQQVYSRVGNVEQEIIQTREMIQKQQDQLSAYFAHMGFHPPPPQ